MTKTNNNIKLATIIPIFNGLDFTKVALKSLFECFELVDGSKLENKIIVVDDGSTDGSAQWIAENYPDVVILSGDGNLWWSGGINMGIEYALNEWGCDFVLWWNNDIKSDIDYYQHIEKIITSQPESVIIGSKIYYSNEPQRIWSMGGYFNPRNGKKYMYGFKEMDEGQYEQQLEVDWLPGMGTIIHASVFEKIGAVDAHNFPQYHGDSDFTHRAKMEGLKLILEPSLKIWNNTDNSGYRKKKSVKDLKQTLFGLRSNYNIKKDIAFYRIHSQSIWAYQELVRKYFLYLGGFIKWRVIDFFSKNKNID
jgi:hypothetical protein